MRALIALLEIAVGIVIVSDPHIGYTALAVIEGIWLIRQRYRHDHTRRRA